MSTKLEKLDLPKFKLEDFEVKSTLGTGTSLKLGTIARVRLVREKKTGQCYAIKIFKKSEIVKEKLSEHINKEAKVLSLVSFPFIVLYSIQTKFIGFSQTDTFLYFLFEYVQGGELYSYMRNKIILEYEECIFYAGQVVLIFQYLHNINIIYRDLKPENLLIDLDGYLKLCDFGFAKVCTTGKTQTRLGTPNYIAPEILLNKGHGKSADWWTLGIFVFEMIAGIDPFNSDDPMTMYSNILESNLKFPINFDRYLFNFRDAKNVSKRYGNLKRGTNIIIGVKDIMNHRWFDQLDWDYLQNKKLIPIYVPQVGSPADTVHFSQYPDSQEHPQPVARKDDPFSEW